MLGVVKEMSIQYLFKNNNYELSNRNYEADYSNQLSLKTDMTMSGKYLSSYPRFNIQIKKFCEYPSHKIINNLEQDIKNKFKIQNQVIIGSGSNGLLQNLVKIFFNKGGNLVTPYLTFNQAEFATSSLNCYTKRVYMKNNNIDLKRMYNSIDKDTKMVYICNPNNPTGLILKNKDIINFSKKIDCTLVIDESAIEFSNKESLLNEKNISSNIIILRTFSKAYGIASLRVGYLVCNKQFQKKYKQNITVNEVSGVSCIIAKRVLNSNKYKKNINKIQLERNYLTKELKKIFIECYESESNIILTKTYFKKEIIQLLINYEISVLPVYDEKKNLLIRIAIQDHKTNKHFIKTLTNILKNNKFILG